MNNDNNNNDNNESSYVDAVGTTQKMSKSDIVYLCIETLAVAAFAYLIATGEMYNTIVEIASVFGFTIK